MKLTRIVIVLLVITAIGTGFIAGRASADQPRMQAALEHLRMARTELEKADRDKGGQRDKALRLTHDAMDEVERGMRFDRRH